MKKTLIAIFILLSCFTKIRAQDFQEVSGFILSCDLKELLPFCELELYEDNNLILETITDLNGYFSLNAEKGKQLKLIIKYPFHYSKEIDFIPDNDSILSECLSFYERGEIQSDTTIILVYHYYGFPPHDRVVMGKGLDYGIFWENHGCIIEDSFERQNALIDTLMIMRKGPNWEEEFWNEIEEIRDKIKQEQKLKEKEKKRRKRKS